MDHSVLKNFKEKIYYKGERHEVSLPWKDPDYILSELSVVSVTIVNFTSASSAKFKDIESMTRTECNWVIKI